MDSKERVCATINYEMPDRLPLGFIWAYRYVIENIADTLGINADNFDEGIGSDFRSVQPIYKGPKLVRDADGLTNTIWGYKTKMLKHSSGYYQHAAYKPFEGIEQIEEAKKIKIPESDWYDYANIYNECLTNQQYALFTGFPHYMDFLNGIGNMRGYEQVMIDIALDSPILEYLVEKRFDFFYEVLSRTLEAARGKIDIVFVGDDLGTQDGLVIGIDSFEKLFAGKYKKVFELAHGYGAKTMMHSCGSVVDVIPLLIDLGLDILDAVQVDAKGMDIKSLHDKFYKKIIFHGSMSVQTLLKNGTKEEIIEETEFRKKLFKEGGLIFAPTNGLQPDMPVENFKTMIECIMKCN